MQARVEPLRRIRRADLARIALGPELLVARQGLQCITVGSRALEPIRDALLGDPSNALRHAGLATVLLRKHVDSDLTPRGGNHDVGRLEDHRSVGVDDTRGPRLENDAGIRIIGGRIYARKLHANSLGNFEHAFELYGCAIAR